MNEATSLWPRGGEKPGLLDSNNVIRDLSGVIPDLGGDVLLPESLAQLRQIDPATLPRSTARRASAPAWPGRQVHLRRPELLRPRR